MTEFFDLTIPMNPWVVLPLVFFVAIVIAYVINVVILWRSGESFTGAAKSSKAGSIV